VLLYAQEPFEYDHYGMHLLMNHAGHLSPHRQIDEGAQVMLGGAFSTLQLIYLPNCSSAIAWIGVYEWQSRQNNDY
jgi:hypothetical protein